MASNRQQAQLKRQAVWITDAACTTALGDSRQSTWDGLINNRSAIRPVNGFSAPFSGKLRVAARIDDLTSSRRHSRVFSLIDRVLAPFSAVPPASRLITATTKAGIDFFERRRLGETIDSEDLLLASIAHHVSRRLDISGPMLNISAACASGTLAVGKAAALIATGLADSVVVICADLVTDFVLSGFSALKALSPGPCRPFDRHRQGLSLGEGAAAVTLMSGECARRHGRPLLGRILGWGASNDATHMTAPDRNGKGLIQAIHQALGVAGLSPDDIHAVNAHGTGTIYNDQMEMIAFDAVFGQRPLNVFSIKGAIGHTLGAAGGIETVIGLESLRRKMIPPTTGFQVAAQGVGDRVSMSAKPSESRYMLSTNSGFGGVNGALVIGAAA